ARSFGGLNLPLFRAIEKTVLRSGAYLYLEIAARSNAYERRSLFNSARLAGVLVQDCTRRAQRFINALARILRANGLSCSGIGGTGFLGRACCGHSVFSHKERMSAT